MISRNVVYKLTRSDSLEYIGISTNFRIRLKEHVNSKRFSKLGIVYVEILYQGEYSDCEIEESYFVEKYNTYNKGLNVTPDGKGSHLTSCKFNTLGHVYSDESRKRMSDNHYSKKEGYVNNFKGKQHSEHLKKHWSNLRKGKIWCPLKLSLEERNEIILSFKMREPFDITTLLKYCKKSQYNLIAEGKLTFDEMITKGGTAFKYETIFCHEQAAKYNRKVGHARIAQIIKL